MFAFARYVEEATRAFVDAWEYGSLNRDPIATQQILVKAGMRLLLVLEYTCLSWAESQILGCKTFDWCIACCLSQGLDLLPSSPFSAIIPISEDEGMVLAFLR